MVKARAGGRCQAEAHEPDCDGTGSECDHIVRGDDHSLPNLQWLSTPCHAAKTRREARDELLRRHAKRVLERHPGRLR